MKLGTWAVWFDPGKIFYMTPGCALDALVAEKVMGCTALVRQEWSWSNSGGDVDSDKGINYWCECGMHGSREKGIKNYSTDIAAAWEVIEKILSITGFYCIEKHPLAEHSTCWMMIPGTKIEEGIVAVEDQDCVSATAPTVPHAICLAALKVVGVDVSTAPASPSQTP